MDIKSIQTVLKELGFYKGRIDGIVGPMTRNAVIDALDARPPLDRAWTGWSQERHRIAFMQAHFKSLNIETGEIDGWIGPQTLHAFEIFQHIERTGKKPENWRDDVKTDLEAGIEPSPRAIDWPRQRDLIKFYGQMGENQALLKPPYPMLIAWNLSQPVKRFSIHEKCHDSAERVLKRVAGHYSPEDIVKHGFNLFGGCLNVRKMRGGSSWSTHSWAIAIDFDPSGNQYKWGRDRAYLDDPACEQFWKFWEEEGWLSLGRARNFDWMHVQAARL